MSELDIDAIFFDLDGTLFDKSKAEEMALIKIYENHQEVFEDVEKEQMIHAFREANKLGHKEFHERKSLDKIRSDRGERIMEMLEVEMSFADEFTSLFYEIYPTMDVPIDGAERVVNESLSRYDVGMISNGSKDVQMAKLEVLGMTDKFEVVLFSEAVGIRKPDRKIFDLASDKMGYENEDCLYVGDSYKSDMIGAGEADMHTCWMNRDGKEKDGDYEPDLEITELPQLLEDI
ncbi:MAG: HAD family hydrolase [Thermoplasmatota archaeon]